MPEHNDVFLNETGYEQSFRRAAEREKLANNLRTLRRIAWDLRAKICQLEQMFDDMTDFKADMKSLQDEINLTAESLGLELTPDNEGLVPR
jgi:hypothetical protein